MIAERINHIYYNKRNSENRSLSDDFYAETIRG